MSGSQPVSQPVSAGSSLEPLSFTAELVPDLAATLQNLGYETLAVAEDMLTTEALGARVTAELESAGPDDLLLIHVISHGRAGDGDGDGNGNGNATVYVLGSDGSPHQQTDVAHWLTNLQNLPGRPLTLFLLDLCFAGAAARLPWQSNVDPRKLRGWVIAACQSRQVAYDGRFTAAVINVLRSVQDGALDIDPGVEHVPLRTVARAIHQEVNRLATEADAAHQQVTATLIDMSVEPDLPFFRNPTYVNDSRNRLRTHLEPGLLPFLDDLHEGLDTKHFLERAAGVGRLAEHADGLVGCFSGRKRELRRLSPWMDGFVDKALAVVTGSPGVGKSALLGVLVCAGHPQLREPTKPVWEHVEPAPYPIIDGLAAVHARSRGLSQIVESIAAQLGIPTEVSAAELVSLMSERATPAVVVLDALDEADGAETILNELLLPMARAHRANGSAVVRLLVGLRRYDEFQPLLALARESGLFVDLDDVPGEELEDDLQKYVMELLRAVPAYRRHGAVSGAFASEVAQVLATAGEDTEGRRWGPFLVAGLFTRHLITTHPEPSQLGPGQAEHLGANAPRSLPEVLELDLKGRLNQPWLRPVMAVLAQARGQGMPITIIARAAAALDTRLPTPTLSDIRGALGEAKFFLRQATDTDRTTVYRLFHQGLVDHLSAHPFDSDHDDIDYPDVLLTALLAPLGPARARDWAAAEPYLFRHVLDHAAAADRITDILTDPAFLLHPKAAKPLAELDPAQDQVLGLLAELRPADRPAISRDALALAAARHGLADLARHTAALSLPTPMSWQPRWTVSPSPRVAPVAVATPAPSVDAAVELRSAAHNGAVCTVSLSSNSRMLVSRGADSSVHVWDQTSVVQLPDRFRWRGAVIAIGLSTDGRHLALGTDGHHIHLIDLVSGNTSSQPAGQLGATVAVAIKTGENEVVSVDVQGNVALGGKRSDKIEPTVRTGQRWAIWAATFEDLGPLVVSGDVNGVVTLWNVRSGESRLVAQHPSRVKDVAVGGGGHSIVSAGEDGSVRVWTKADHLVWSAPIAATAVAVDATGSMVITGSRYRGLLLWDTATDSVLERLDHPVPVTAVALSADAQAVGFGDGAGTIGIWRPASTSRRQAKPHGDGPAGSPPPLCAVAMGPGDGLPIVVVGDAAGLVSTVHLASGDLTGQTCEGTEPVRTIAFQQIGETHFARVSWASNETRLWEPTSGTVIDAGAWAGLPTADQIDTDRRTVLLKDQLVEVIGQPDGSVHLRDAARQDIIGTLPGGHDGPVTAVACGLLTGRPTALTGGDDGTVRVWDLLDQRMVEVIQMPGPVFGISYTTPGELLVGAGGEVIAFRHHASSGDS